MQNAFLPQSPTGWKAININYYYYYYYYYYCVCF